MTSPIVFRSTAALCTSEPSLLRLFAACFFFFFLQSSRREGKHEDLAYHTCTYFHTYVVVNLTQLYSQSSATKLACPSAPGVSTARRAVPTGELNLDVVAEMTKAHLYVLGVEVDATLITRCG